MIHFDKSPTPRLPSLFLPPKAERLNERIYALHRKLGKGPACSSDLKLHGNNSGVPVPNQATLFVLDRAGKKLTENFLGLLQHKVFVMLPTIGIVVRDKVRDAIPIPVLHRAKQISLVQPKLPLWLPKRGQEENRDKTRNQNRWKNQSSIHRWRIT